MEIVVMIVTIITIIIIIITTMRIVIVIIIMMIIYHSMLDLLGIEFHHFFMYVIFNIISWIISLKSLCDSTFFFSFYLNVFFLILSFNISFLK